MTKKGLINIKLNGSLQIGDWKKQFFFQSILLVVASRKNIMRTKNHDALRSSKIMKKSNNVRKRNFIRVTVVFVRWIVWMIHFG